MQRSIALLILIVGLLGPTWIRSPIEAVVHPHRMTVSDHQITPGTRFSAHLGPFRFERGWQLRGPEVGGYSALLAYGGGKFVTLSDDGQWLAFQMATDRPWHHAMGKVKFGKIAREKNYRDVESAVRDARTGTIWLGMEGINAIARTDGMLRSNARVEPEAMKDWGFNSGPESIVRIPDGRFVLIREAPSGYFYGTEHKAVIFDGDPITSGEPREFSFTSAPNFSVVDMTLLPDGRVLILMRRFVWPMPMQFAGRIAIADPATIEPGKPWPAREIAALSSDLPVDNFEGIAVTPGEAGRLNVWLISDDNFMTTQQKTLLWKLSVDPDELPWPKAGDAAR